MANLKGFEASLKKFGDSIGVGVATVVKKITLETFTGIVQKTPVDTGRARASWVISLETPGQSPGIPENAKFSESAATAKASGQLSKVNQIKPFSTVFISNNLPYIEVLEDGSSKQAPQGMVAVTLEEVNRNLTRITRDF